jgi:MFS family permease
LESANRVAAIAARVGGRLARPTPPRYLGQTSPEVPMAIRSTLVTARPAAAAFAAMGIVWGTFAAALPDLKAMLDVDESRLGLLMLFTPIAAVLAMLVAPAAGAALGRVALPAAAIAMALVFAVPGQTTIVWLFPFAMMLCGAATGLTDVLMNARVAALENERKLHLMNLCHAAYSFGYAGGALATGAMRSANWPPGWVMGTMALVAFLLALATIERDGTIHGLRKPKDGTAGHLGLIPVIGGAIVLIAFMTENAAENWSALHIEKTLGGTPAEGAMGPAALALTMGFARLAGQGIASRANPFWLLCGGAVISACGALVAAMATSPSMAYAGFIVMGVGSSVIAPTAFSLVGQLAEPQARARAVARATLLGYFGYFFGPPTLGFLAGAFGLRMAFVFAAVMLLTVLVLAPIMARVRAGVQAA